MKQWILHIVQCRHNKLYRTINCMINYSNIIQYITQDKVDKYSPGVPHLVVKELSEHTTANPKSAILILASSSAEVSSKFSGFKSLFKCTWRRVELGRWEIYFDVSGWQRRKKVWKQWRKREKRKKEGRKEKE